MTGERAELAARLIVMPADIETAEKAVCRYEQALKNSKERFAHRECSLILGEQITGKNAEQRKAQLDQLMAADRQELARCDLYLEEARITLRRAQNEFSAAKAIARLLVGAE